MANSAGIGYTPATTPRDFTRLDGDATEAGESPVAVEVPVALVYNGRTHVVMMCTPEDLEDFATGFTVTEGITTAGAIRRADVVRYRQGIELQLEIPADAAERLATRGRGLVGRTGCGLCGVEAIGDALREPSPLRSAATFTREALWRAADALGTQQPLNATTNTIHAAAFADASGALRVVREDVGRHNALDKVIGAMTRAGTDGSAGFIVVTSRASYELVQKAAVANVPMLAAISRPTALAIDIAETAGMTLVGLLRGHSANVYTHPERLRG